jgi:hypothetical protein
MPTLHVFCRPEAEVDQVLADLMGHRLVSIERHDNGTSTLVVAGVTLTLGIKLRLGENPDVLCFWVQEG